MTRILTTLLMALSIGSIFAQGRMPVVKENIPLDSIRLSDSSHKSVKGRTIRIPHLFEVGDSGDKLVVKGQFHPL